VTILTAARDFALHVCVCVYVCARARARARACVCVCVCAAKLQEVDLVIHRKGVFCGVTNGSSPGPDRVPLP